MKPPPLDYAAPGELAEVLGLLADEDREAKVIAGGQSLMPLLNMRLARPDLLVDIAQVGDLPGITVDGDGALTIGAQVTQARALEDPLVGHGWPVLAQGMACIAHPQIRNRGTVCGSLAHNDPAAELPALAVALDASFHVESSRGSREIPAEQMFVTVFTTALQPGELLTHVRFPAPTPGTGWCFAELSRRRGDFATIGVVVGLRREDKGPISWARIVFCGAGAVPVRAPGAEHLLTGGSGGSDLFADAAGTAAAEIDPPEDIHASAQFRRDAARHLVARALEAAWTRTS